jgi:murein DD-endopeptidase MepM/ murein hydrolase activator NlpD
MRHVKHPQLRHWLLAIGILAISSCGGSGSEAPPPNNPIPVGGTGNTPVSAPCDESKYPEPAASAYVLPFRENETYFTGLTNCSSSFHATGQPDQYAFDFDMPSGTPFIAARAGTVVYVVQDQPSDGGGVGNYLVIDHHDGTYGLYYHSPNGGISVMPGEQVRQGQLLGVTGSSGLAGYPHLHFIVVEGSPNYPYNGAAVSFRNASPADKILKSNTQYRAEPR